mgnify:CR=1 FL=1
MMNSISEHDTRIGPSVRINLSVHAQDDPKRIEHRFKDAGFDSWSSITSYLHTRNVDINGIVDDINAADPAADRVTWAGFIWGAARAVKVSGPDPSMVALGIAQGLEDFTLPLSPAYTSRFAQGLGRLASLLLQRWTGGMAIIGGRIPPGYIEMFWDLAKCAGSLRGRRWNLSVVCRPQGLSENLPGNRGYIPAEVEFSQQPGFLRVSRSSAADRPQGSPPVIYQVAAVEQGMAILEFEHIQLCATISEPEAALFAHPIAGTYLRRARAAGKLARALAVVTPETGGGNMDTVSLISTYMAGMYTDFEVCGIERDARGMEAAGFPGISGTGAVKTIMALAHRITAAIRKSQSPD